MKVSKNQLLKRIVSCDDVVKVLFEEVKSSSSDGFDFVLRLCLIYKILSVNIDVSKANLSDRSIVSIDKVLSSISGGKVV